VGMILVLLLVRNTRATERGLVRPLWIVHRGGERMAWGVRSRAWLCLRLIGAVRRRRAWCCRYWN